MAASLLVLLILALSSFFGSADVLWNINCGTSQSYTDGNNVTWTGDDTLVRTGKSNSVPSSNSMNPVLDTLRVFKSGERNCYFIGAEKGAKMLLVATFYYGNYDKKSSPPRFDLEVDGNDWVTVVTSSRIGYYIYYELFFAAKGDNVSVCFLRTHRDQFPFISSLQLRSLPSNMYQDLDPDHALDNQASDVFGLDQSWTDDYGRTWDPAGFIGSGYSTVSRSNASAVNTAVISDNPPQAVFNYALTTSNISARSIKLPLVDHLPTSPSPIYIIMYFTELTLLNSTQKRSFTVNVNDKPVQSSKPITPTYGNATEFSVYNILASQNTTFTLVSTDDSTLPPIISAIELFLIYNYTQTSPGPYETPKSKSKLPIILGVGIPGLAILMLLVIMIVKKQKKKRAAKAKAKAKAAVTTKTAETETTTEETANAGEKEVEIGPTATIEIDTTKTGEKEVEIGPTATTEIDTTKTGEKEVELGSTHKANKD